MSPHVQLRHNDAIISDITVKASSLNIIINHDGVVMARDIAVTSLFVSQNGDDVTMMS